MQPESSALIHPNGGSQLDKPTLTEKTDKGTYSEEESGSDSGSESDSDSHSGSAFLSESPSEPDILWENPLSYLREITDLRVERVRLLQKRPLFKESL